MAYHESYSLPEMTGTQDLQSKSMITVCHYWLCVFTLATMLKVFPTFLCILAMPNKPMEEKFKIRNLPVLCFLVVPIF